MKKKILIKLQSFLIVLSILIIKINYIYCIHCIEYTFSLYKQIFYVSKCIFCFMGSYFPYLGQTVENEVDGLFNFAYYYNLYSSFTIFWENKTDEERLYFVRISRFALFFPLSWPQLLVDLVRYESLKLYYY